MHLRSLNEDVTVEDGLLQIAFDLGGSEAGYLIISRPVTEELKDEFFGADHYIEIKDQLFGSYGGIEKLVLEDDSTALLRLTKDVPGLGREFVIVADKALTKKVLDELRRLERH